MIKHVVAFRLNEGVSAQQEDAMLQAFRALEGQIPELHSFTIGRNLSDRDQTYTHCLVAEMDDMDAVGRYLVHPAHKAAVDDHLAPIMEHRIVVDYTF
ncbi:Stress responsive A/B Barrel Domain protein [compost metagenome]